MHWIANIFYLTGLYVIYQGSFGARENYSTENLLFSISIGLPLLLLGLWLNTKVERKKVKNTEQLINGIAVKDEADFFLYLRPFKSTNAFRIKDNHLNLFSWDLADRTGFDDIENLLARALSPTAPFVALGSPDEHLGAARILTSEADWRDEIRKIADKCRLILLIPSSQPGTLWEMKHILNNLLLEKTVFVMPPSDSFFYTKAQYDVLSDWNEMLKECNKFGLELPTYVAGGALFALKLDQTIKKSFPFPVPDPREWSTSLQNLIDIKNVNDGNDNNKDRLKPVKRGGHYLKWLLSGFAILAAIRIIGEIIFSA